MLMLDFVLGVLRRAYDAGVIDLDEYTDCLNWLVGLRVTAENAKGRFDV